MSFITNYLYYLAGYCEIDFEKTDITIKMTKEQYIQYEKDRNTKYKALTKIKAKDYILRPLKVVEITNNTRKIRKEKRKERRQRTDSLNNNIL